MIIDDRSFGCAAGSVFRLQRPCVSEGISAFYENQVVFAFLLIIVCDYFSSLNLAASCEVIFNTGKPDVGAARETNWRGVILCELYHWRKTQPVKFIQNLLHNERFGHFVARYTGCSADDCYRFVAQPSGENQLYDRRFLDNFNRQPLVDGSNAANTQEDCNQCGCSMPGLCYPNARQNTGQSENCHACLYDIGLHSTALKYNNGPMLYHDNFD